MTILVASDFSPCSRAAVNMAAALANRTGAHLVLFHAIHRSPLDAFASCVEPGCEQEVRDGCASVLGGVATELRQRGISVDTQIYYGAAARGIINSARALGADLIVVGTHGRHRSARWMLGSCAEEVVRTAACTVVVTPADPGPLARWMTTEPLRLVFATDGSNASASGLLWLRTSPTFTRGAHPPTIRFRVVSYVDREGISDGTPSFEADAVVVGIPKALRGSSTGPTIRSVLRAATVPVFCIPEGHRPESLGLPEARPA